MTTKRRWTREETVQLIEKYEAAPALWDTTSPEYRDREKKSVALYGMASHFATTSSEITRKLHNLRCQMNNEIRKQRHRNLNPWRRDPYVSSWEFYNSLKFINVEAENSEAADSYAEVPPEETLHVEKIFKQELMHDPQDAVEEAPPAGAEARAAPSHKPLARKKPRLKPDPAGGADDHQAFGDFVASELRAVQAAALKRRLKQTIERDILQVCYDDDSADSDGGARPRLGYNSVPVYICSPVRYSDPSDDEFS